MYIESIVCLLFVFLNDKFILRFIQLLQFILHGS